ncbi:MAG: glycosyltransferase family 2 protein [Anaerolineae bacterium]|nr:glycosyltransferase family 2 protein [Anaerolineae bacterium]
MMAHDKTRSGPFDISFVMPAYNEQEIIGYTIRRLFAAFEKEGYRLELVAVDNGSQDRTGEIIREFAETHPGMIGVRVETNQGYGNGILEGIPHCTAPWIGIIPADGQVDAEDVVHLYEAIMAANRPVIGKVRRRFRMDGFRRKLVSVAYNLLVLAMYPEIGSLDINGSPKLAPRDVVTQMRLQSVGWFLDPEIMIKAHYMQVPVIEFNVFARMRGSGVSHVRVETCWEFMRALLHYRFSDHLAGWRQEIKDRRIAETPSSGVLSHAGH